MDYRHSESMVSHSVMSVAPKSKSTSGNKGIGRHTDLFTYGKNIRPLEGLVLTTKGP